MIELAGWLSAIMFSLCSIPQAYHCYREKSAKGIDGLFLFLWIGGEVAGLIYSIGLDLLPLFFNYGLNLVGTGIILYYFVKDRTNN